MGAKTRGQQTMTPKKSCVPGAGGGTEGPETLEDLPLTQINFVPLFFGPTLGGIKSGPPL